MIMLDAVSQVVSHPDRPQDRARQASAPIFESGHNFGILGVNGAGKSTLIRLLAGSELPDRGRVRRYARVSFPLGFGGTFHGALSGRENVAFIARIYGAAIRADDRLCRGVRRARRLLSNAGQYLFRRHAGAARFCDLPRHRFRRLSDRRGDRDRRPAVSPQMRRGVPRAHAALRHHPRHPQCPNDPPVLRPGRRSRQWRADIVRRHRRGIGMLTIACCRRAPDEGADTPRSAQPIGRARLLFGRATSGCRRASAAGFPYRRGRRRRSPFLQRSGIPRQARSPIAAAVRRSSGLVDTGRGRAGDARRRGTIS